jgi:hypothetical protein
LLDALLYHHHRDVIVYLGIWLHGNRSKGTTRTSPADTGPSRRRKTESRLVSGDGALQTLPDRGCNQWPQRLSGLPGTVSMASIVWKVVGGIGR